MKKFNTLGFALCAVLMLGLTFASCTKKKGCTDPNSLNYDQDAEEDDGSCQYSSVSFSISDVTVNGQTYKQISGTINESVTLTTGNKYLLSDGVFVSSGHTLTVEAGTEIYGNPVDGADFLVISQGADINAVGTATNPIVMSSLTEAKGSWGGLIINGYANINNGSTAEAECGSGTYGGSDDADNSGILRYVRIEYAGFICATDDELNGLTLNAVGSETTIDHIQCYKGADDGIEFFGGAVNVRYAVSTGNKDDSFDWTHGWRGKGQFWVVHQDHVSGDRAIEADNNGDDNGAAPYSEPLISNITLVGGTDADAENTGMRLREGTKGKIYNAIVVNFPNNGVRVSNSITTNNMNNGSLLVANSISFNNGTNWKDCAVFENDTTNSSIDPGLNGYVGTVTTNAIDPTTLDAWFMPANYIGAVEAGNDWTAGWTRNL